MTRVAVHEYAAALRTRYQGSSKREKGRILDEFCRVTGLHRKAAIRLLHQPPRLAAVQLRRPRRYGPAVVEALVGLWGMSDRLCGKLLAPLLPTLVGALERHGALAVSEGVRAALLTISPATIDRLLRKERRGGRRQPQGQSVVTAALRSQVPVRTWSEWQGVTPGALQADLVLHCGERTEGFI